MVQFLLVFVLTLKIVFAESTALSVLVQNIESTFYILYIGKASGYEAYLDIFGGIYLSAK